MITFHFYHGTINIYLSNYMLNMNQYKCKKLLKFIWYDCSDPFKDIVVRQELHDTKGQLLLSEDKKEKNYIKKLDALIEYWEELTR